MALGDVIDHFTRREFPQWLACEALGRVDLDRIEHGKKLVTPGLDNAHSALQAACPVSL